MHCFYPSQPFALKNRTKHFLAVVKSYTLLLINVDLCFDFNNACVLYMYGDSNSFLGNINNQTFPHSLVYICWCFFIEIAWFDFNDFHIRM